MAQQSRCDRGLSVLDRPSSCHAQVSQAWHIRGDVYRYLQDFRPVLCRLLPVYCRFWLRIPYPFVRSGECNVCILGRSKLDVTTAQATLPLFAAREICLRSKFCSLVTRKLTSEESLARNVQWNSIDQFRYIKILTWFLGLGEQNNTNETSISKPRCDFFCFIPQASVPSTNFNISKLVY